MSPEQLQVRPAPHLWPIWATAAHLAVTRVCWQCVFLGEPGAERTPFTDSAREGWEDDLDHPRRPDELVFALESSWAIGARCLERWTPDMLDAEFERERDGLKELDLWTGRVTRQT